jgi:hypothetical protein
MKVPCLSSVLWYAVSASVVCCCFCVVSGDISELHEHSELRMFALFISLSFTLFTASGRNVESLEKNPTIYFYHPSIN